MGAGNRMELQIFTSLEASEEMVSNLTHSEGIIAIKISESPCTPYCIR